MFCPLTPDFAVGGSFLQRILRRHARLNFDCMRPMIAHDTTANRECFARVRRLRRDSRRPNAADPAPALKRGLEHPIVLDKDGRILDGRNRLAACRLAGVEPSFTIYGGADPDGYALDVNIARRHMKPGARHLVTEMARRKRNENTKIGNSKKDIAVQSGVSINRLSEAGLVIDMSIDGDLVRDVLSGDKNLQAAADIARVRKKWKEEREAKIARLKKDAADLAKLVGDDAMDVDEAIASLELREQKAARKRRA
jgi:hypothetical protein